MRVKCKQRVGLIAGRIPTAAGCIMDAEPAARWSCSSALVGEKFCVWGGRTRTFPQGLASSVHSFDPFLVRWAENQCRGDPPPGLYYSASASAGRYLYVYGGTDGSKFYNSLHQLDTETWTWKLLSNDGPMKKVACGMTIYDGKVVLFGGCGFQSGPVQPGAEFIQNMNSSDGRGWTNELHSFDLREGEVLGLVLSSILSLLLAFLESI